MGDARIQKMQIGGYGGVTVADTTVTTPVAGNTFIAIKALTDVVLDTVVGNIATLDGLTILAGDVIPGSFSSVKLTSGTAILYYGI